MIIPGTFCAQQCDVELLIKSRHRNIEAVYLIGVAVAVSDSICRRLEQLRAVFLRVICQSRIEIDYLLGLKADVDRHLSVRYSQYSKVFVGLIYMEH